MKIKGASAYICYVDDLDKTADFYQKLGLEIKEQTDNRVIIYINWYRIDFVKPGADDYEQFKGEGDSKNKGAGVFFYFSVDDVDAACEEVKSMGIKCATEPQNTAWGTYEFIVLDPDGYKLVFFTRKVKRNPQN
jgi:catechol 2,3-dioxygenase-like lactoylglutathione lyase family enzyme